MQLQPPPPWKKKEKAATTTLFTLKLKSFTICSIIWRLIMKLTVMPKSYKDQDFKQNAKYVVGWSGVRHMLQIEKTDISNVTKLELVEFMSSI